MNYDGVFWTAQAAGKIFKNQGKGNFNVRNDDEEEDWKGTWKDGWKAGQYNLWKDVGKDNSKSL